MAADGALRSFEGERFAEKGRRAGFCRLPFGALYYGWAVGIVRAFKGWHRFRPRRRRDPFLFRRSAPRLFAVRHRLRTIRCKIRRNAKRERRRVRCPPFAMLRRGCRPFGGRRVDAGGLRIYARFRTFPQQTVRCGRHGRCRRSAGGQAVREPTAGKATNGNDGTISTPVGKWML